MAFLMNDYKGSILWAIYMIEVMLRTDKKLSIKKILQYEL